ncbi:hypothetical protein BRN51_20370 [Xanthomonas oryzae pv. oryzae]|nr:hypothetical protein ATY45_18205 [Xanthomonas oryzae pv. oryzae]AXM41238.1 hypothetical protein BRN51_20370 [Xanthomonas oryzae pv. oryzae]OLK22690.1 hypothetical protein IXO621_09205 [Xanthomonas oryzae pv. oryzae]QBO01558.1 hypothetical protein EBA21_05340 [Xanthomonas oryzae pv. oryzae]RBF86310.1 hypothetical protein BRM95_12360 [Xanthomonas oryzae pv. oryzae]
MADWTCAIHAAPLSQDDPARAAGADTAGAAVSCTLGKIRAAHRVAEANRSMQSDLHNDAMSPCYA